MNLIIVVLDSLRQDHVGAYGHDWIRTPNLDRFSTESVRFENAYPESLPTIPFRNSLVTGKRSYPFSRWRPGLASYPYREHYGMEGRDLMLPGWSPILKEDVTLAEYLGESGFTTALVTDVFHQFYPGMNYHRGYHSWNWVRGQEWDMLRTDLIKGRQDVGRYFTDKTDRHHAKVWELDRYLMNTEHRRSEEDYFAPQVFREACAWLEQNHRCDNFFLYIDCFDPHEPWDPPAYYRNLYADPSYQGPEVIMPLYGLSDYLSPEELRYMRACYAGEVTMVDFWFGHFMNKVNLLGLDKNTLIVVVSDHGHQLGEDGVTGKIPFILNPCLTDLVLMVRHPDGQGAGRSVRRFVLNHDILPTACGLMGIPAPEWAEGLDFWPLVTGEKTSIRDYITCIFKDFILVRTAEHAMTVSTDGGAFVLLYDIQKDPDMKTDISDDHPEIVKRLWQLALDDAHGEIPVYPSKFKMSPEAEAVDFVQMAKMFMKK